MASEYLEVVEKPVETNVEKSLRFPFSAKHVQVFELGLDIEPETNAPNSLHIVNVPS